MLSALVSFFDRKVYPGFRIPNNEIVIDIGSGDKPFWRGDVFYDDLSQSDSQRISTSQAIHDLGLFVNGIVEKTPFKDKAFDFSFCAHLLEHIENPELAIKEITRISKKGYIEVPNGLHESIAPYRSHLWFVYLNGKKLIFVRKSKKMSDILIENGKDYHYLLYRMKEPFIRLNWEKNIEYEIINDIKKSDKFRSKDERRIKSFDRTQDLYIRAQGLYIVLVKILRIVFYRKNDKANLERLIRSEH